MPASKSFRPFNDEYYGDSSNFFDIRKRANPDYRSRDDYGGTGGALWGQGLPGGRDEARVLQQHRQRLLRVRVRRQQAARVQPVPLLVPHRIIRVLKEEFNHTIQHPKLHGRAVVRICVLYTNE